MCIVCILDSGERRILFIVVIVICMKVCLVFLLKQNQSSWHAHNTEQINGNQIYGVCILKGISLLEEHLTSFSKSIGAKGCQWGE